MPKPLPWVKLGLGNIATLLAIYLYDTKTALLIVLVRVVVGAFLLGTFGSPSFVLSLSGGISSALVMGALRVVVKKQLSVVGVSIVGALTHNITQLFFAYLLIVKNFQIVYLFPVLMLPAVLTGVLVGMITFFFLKQVETIGFSTPHWYAP